jgi:MATE family, multidrug efflux pump
VATRLESAPRSHLLSGDVRKVVLTLALPVLLEQFLNFCVGFYDTLLAGHLASDVSEAATGAVGVSAYVGWLASMLFSLVAAGTTALVARARGGGDNELANRVANRSIAMAAIAGVGFLALIVPLAPSLAAALDLGPAAAPITIRYLRFDAIGLVFSSVSLVGAAALRGCGNMRTPMLILGGVSVLNVIVSTTLVYGLGPFPPLGVDGIVAGTVVARTSGGFAMLLPLWRGHSGLRLIAGELRLRGETVRRILAIGIPAAADGTIMWCGHFLFLGIIGRMGRTAFAAHVIGIRVEAITYLPAVAWGVAAATLVGQSLGAGDPERARQAGHTAVRQCCVLGVIITLVFVLGAEPIYRLMHNQPAVAAVGAPAFRLAGFFQIPLIIGIVYFSSMRGAGDTRFPMLVTLFSTFLLRIPLAYLFGVTFGWGLFGAWLGMCIDMLVRGISAAARFASGRWSAVRV